MKELLFIGSKRKLHTQLIAEFVDDFFVSREHTLREARMVSKSRTIGLIIFLHETGALTTDALIELQSLTTYTTHSTALILTEYSTAIEIVEQEHPALRAIHIDYNHLSKSYTLLTAAIHSIFWSPQLLDHTPSANNTTEHHTQHEVSLTAYADMTKQQQLILSNNTPVLTTKDFNSTMYYHPKWHYTSASSQKIEPFIVMCADSPNKSILIVGETGTGKDMVAKRIHCSLYGDPDKFITVNCSAIPETLFENEMYGSEEGGFTGAKRKMGYFEMADEGTLFLNEISELSVSAQAKLLHAMDKQGYYTIGGTTKKNPDFCCIVATNRDLQDMVNRGFFRRDLYYRIKLLSISIPSLRSRKEDIVILANEFVREFSGNQKSLTTDAVDRLVKYDWPGNIRELKNCIQRSVVRCQSSVIDSSNIDISTTYRPSMTA